MPRFLMGADSPSARNYWRHFSYKPRRSGTHPARARAGVEHRSWYWRRLSAARPARHNVRMPGAIPPAAVLVWFQHAYTLPGHKNILQQSKIRQPRAVCASSLLVTLIANSRRGRDLFPRLSEFHATADIHYWRPAVAFGDFDLHFNLSFVLRSTIHQPFEASSTKQGLGL